MQEGGKKSWIDRNEGEDSLQTQKKGAARYIRRSLLLREGGRSGGRRVWNDETGSSYVRGGRKNPDLFRGKQMGRGRKGRPGVLVPIHGRGGKEEQLAKEKKSPGQKRVSRKKKKGGRSLPLLSGRRGSVRGGEGIFLFLCGSVNKTKKKEATTRSMPLNVNKDVG